MKFKRIVGALGAVVVLLLGACAEPTRSAVELDTLTGIRIKSATFELGSVIASGDLTGLGSTDVTMVLSARGVVPEEEQVFCVSPGGNRAPGRNPGAVSGEGQQSLSSANYTRNGRSPFRVRTELTLDPLASGCPNSNWTAEATFIDIRWTSLTVVNTATGEELLRQEYNCTTTKEPATLTCRLR